MSIELKKGDCLDVMTVMPDASVDLVVTSPPYDNLRTYNGTCDWTFEIFKKIADQIYRVIKDGATVVWIVADASIDGGETGTSFRQALYFQEIGMKINDTMIWVKNSFTAVGALRTRYAQTFEYMFIFTKGKGKTFNPITDKKNKCVGKNIHGEIRERDGSTKPMHSAMVGKKIREYGIRYNVWNIDSVKSNTEHTGHPAQFPVQLAHDHIISWSNAGDVVLDPFMGSGSTGVACINTNRNFIGIERVSEYFEIAKKRIDNRIKEIEVEKANSLF